jgi:hypothetical protein
VGLACLGGREGRRSFAGEEVALVERQAGFFGGWPDCLGLRAARGRMDLTFAEDAAASATGRLSCAQSERSSSRRAWSAGVVVEMGLGSLGGAGSIGVLRLRAETRSAQDDRSSLASGHRCAAPGARRGWCSPGRRAGLDAQGGLDVLAAVEALAGAALVGLELGELGLPEAQHVGGQGEQPSHVADAEVELVGDLRASAGAVGLTVLRIGWWEAMAQRGVASPIRFGEKRDADRYRALGRTKLKYRWQSERWRLGVFAGTVIRPGGDRRSRRTK